MACGSLAAFKETEARVTHQGSRCSHAPLMVKHYLDEFTFAHQPPQYQKSRQASSSRAGAWARRPSRCPDQVARSEAPLEHCACYVSNGSNMYGTISKYLPSPLTHRACKFVRRYSPTMPLSKSSIAAVLYCRTACCKPHTMFVALEPSRPPPQGYRRWTPIHRTSR